MADLAVARLAPVEIGAGDGEHVVAEVDAQAEADLAGQQLQDPTGAGADVEQVGGPILGEQVVQLGLDQGRVDRERPLAVPRLGPLGEEPLGLPAPRLAHRLEPPLVVTIARSSPGRRRHDERATRAPSPFWARR